MDAGSETDGQHDERPPEIVSSEPIDFEPGVGILISPTFVFSEPLDPTTVTEASIWLEDVEGHRVASVFAYDETTYTLILDPVQPLDHGYAYVVQLTGVRDLAGRPLEFDPTRLHFTTHYNGRTRFEDPAAPIVRETRADVDSRGRLLREVDYTGPGPDGTWGSGDDVVFAYRAWEYAELTATVEEYVAIGADGVWFSDDDELSQTTTHTFDERGAVVSSVTFVIGQPNGEQTVYEYTDGRLSMKIHYHHPGVDRRYGTADDRSLGYQRFEYDEVGRLVRTTSYDFGRDREWVTADDEVVDIEATTFSPDGLSADRRLHTDIGPDAEWLTSDDSLGRVFLEQYDEDGLLERIDEMQLGGDSTWFTGDDYVDRYTVTTFDADGNRIATVVNRTGADHLTGTGDDYVEARSTYSTND